MIKMKSKILLLLIALLFTFSLTTFSQMSGFSEKEKAFFDAAVEGNKMKVMKGIFEDGVGINTRGKYYETALHWAARYGNYEVVELLVGQGADVNAIDQKDITPLHLAMLYGHYEIADYLISYGANPEAYDYNGMRPVDLADLAYLKEPDNKETTSYSSSNEFSSKEETKLSTEAYPEGAIDLYYTYQKGTTTRIITEMVIDIGNIEISGIPKNVLNMMYGQLSGGNPIKNAYLYIQSVNEISVDDVLEDGSAVLSSSFQKIEKLEISINDVNVPVPLDRVQKMIEQNNQSVKMKISNKGQFLEFRDTEGDLPESILKPLEKVIGKMMALYAFPEKSVNIGETWEKNYARSFDLASLFKSMDVPNLSGDQFKGNLDFEISNTGKLDYFSEDVIDLNYDTYLYVDTKMQPNSYSDTQITFETQANSDITYGPTNSLNANAYSSGSFEFVLTSSAEDEASRSMGMDDIEIKFNGSFSVDVYSEK